MLAAELRQQAEAARAQATAVEALVAEAEGRHQQLEAVLHENHASLQQRNAELALARKVGRWVG